MDKLAVNLENLENQHAFSIRKRGSWVNDINDLQKTQASLERYCALNLDYLEVKFTA